MRNINYLLAILAIFVLILSGCNQDEQKSAGKDNTDATASSNNVADSEKNKETDQNKETNDIKVDPLPATYEELASRKVGEHHNFHFNLNEKEIQKMLETFKDLPDISKNPTDEELDYFYQELLSKVQKGYKGPEEAIRQLRFQSIGNPEMEDTRYQFKENLNVEIILDASGSMAQAVNGQVKMDAAKASIINFVKELPKEAKVGIRVYGHKGSNADADKKLSCSSSDIMYPISTYDESHFQSALNNIKPTGWTPIGLALNEAKKDLSQFDGASNTNIIYLVSDGVSTCDDEPVKAAKELYDSNISPIVNIIGFNVDSEGQNQLKEIANATEGLYANVADENQLSEELSKLNNLAETWKQWKEQGEQSLEYKKVSNNLDIFVYITEEESKSIDEKISIDLIVSQFWQSGLMDEDSRVYLEEKNKQYHDWIDGQIEKFNNELKALNEKNYAEAIKTLEDKYQQNTQ